jgi:hypothetical protein
VGDSGITAATVLQAVLSKNGWHRPGTKDHAPPGDTPKMETYILYNSVEVMPVVEVSPGIYKSGAQVTDPKARDVDQGTSRVPARPFAALAKDTTEAIVRSDIAARLRY